MTKGLIVVCALLLAMAADAAPPDATIGVAALHVADPLGGRTLGGLIWYPAKPGGETVLIGDNAVFVGVRAIRDAAIADGRFSLVLLSHGFGGNVRNQDWLAADLAARGMVVAAINHPGSTTGDASPRTALEIWNRPADIGRTITDLLHAQPFASHIDVRRIAVIGHSLGGYTALALAGARVDRDAYARYCETAADEGCADVRAAIGSVSAERFGQANRDPSVVAVVAMAPALTPAYQPDSLRRLAAPALVIGGALDRIIPAGHVRRIAALLPPGSAFMELSGATHFSFFPECKPAGPALLRETGDDPICDGDADRAALHARIAERIETFLAGALTSAAQGAH